jgi:CHAD domain-containing protein
MKHAAELLRSLDDSWRRLSTRWKKAQTKASESAIHDFRVAARRFISRLDMAAAVLGDDDVLPARKRVKKTLKRMGPLRDLHVQMETLAAVSESALVKDFKKSLKRGITDASPDAEHCLREDRRQRVKKTVDDLKTALKRQSDELTETGVRQPIDRLVATRLQEYTNARQRFEPGDESALHTMRIALKKLRYTVEAAQDFIGGWDDSALRKMQVAQKHMGETRDIQILMTQLKDWAVSRNQEVEAADILNRLERKRNALITRIARSSRAMDAGRSKQLHPARETTRAASSSSEKARQTASKVNSGNGSI